MTYEKYKPSGIDWIGEIPEHWGLKRLKQNFYIKGRIGWQELRADEFSDDGVHCVTGTDLIEGRVNWESCYRVSKKRYNVDENIQLKENDLLITKDGTIGKVASVKNLPEKATLNSGIFLIRPTKLRFFNDYLYWILNSPILTDFNDYTKTGTTINHLYQNVFERMHITVPSLNEQKEIANYLYTEIPKIDSLISNKKSQIEKLKELRQIEINNAVTKGLTPDIEMKDSGVEWLGEIPKHWVIRRVKNISGINDNSIVDGPFGSSVNVDTDYVDEGIPVVRTINITNDGFNDSDLKFMRIEKYLELKRHSIQPGDILLSKVGTIGNCCVFPDYYKEGILSTTGSCKITVNSKKFFNHYYVLFFQTIYEHFQLLASSNVQPFLNLNTIKNINIVVPPLSEQIEIVQFLKKRLSLIDNFIKNLTSQIQKLEELRKIKIYEAVTGKIIIHKKVEEYAET